MKSIARYLLALVVLGCFLGCRKPTYSSNSMLTITPGIGIKGVIQLGMTLPEIRKNTGDLVVHKNDDPDPFYRLDEGWIFGFDIPSLGVTHGQMRRDVPLQGFSILVGEHEPDSPAPARSLPKFRGTLVSSAGRSLSFHSAGVVKRKDVIAVFGQPDKLIDSRGDLGREGWMRDVGPTVASLLKTGHSVEWLTTPWGGQIIYPRQGIGFAVDSNGVYSVSVTRWTEPENVDRDRVPHR